MWTDEARVSGYKPADMGTLWVGAHCGLRIQSDIGGMLYLLANRLVMAAWQKRMPLHAGLALVLRPLHEQELPGQL